MRDQRLTGRKVDAFMSGNHIGADLAAELFVLDQLVAVKPIDPASS
jgi:hypothetical protein